MKTTLNILTLVLIIMSCGRPNKNKNIELVVNDTVQTNLEKEEKELLKKRKEIEERNKIDSLKLEKILTDALKFSNQNRDKDRFHKEYEVIPDKEYIIKVEISLDNHFTKSYSHLIIRRSTPGVVYIDIYSNSNKKFEKVVSHEQWAMTYVNDTIRDINGDGLNDYVVNWYGASGCCLKAFSDIYLLRSDKKSFSNNFEFINPTFSPEEKIIRGVCYGHPGDTEMYKYKWAGERVDTLEYIFFEKNDRGEKTGKVIVTNRDPYVKKFKVLKRVDNVPTEYKKIKGYDWFTGAL